MAQYLASRGLRLACVPPDGNCLFHAVVHQLSEPHITHLELRQMTAEFISTNRSHFEPFVTSNFEQFISDLARPKEWAGDDALRGVAEVLRTHIRVIAMDSVDYVYEPQLGSGTVVTSEIVLFYNGTTHYDAMEPMVPPTQAGVRQLSAEQVARINTNRERARMLRDRKRSRSPTTSSGSNSSGSPPGRRAAAAAAFAGCMQAADPQASACNALCLYTDHVMLLHMLTTFLDAKANADAVASTPGSPHHCLEASPGHVHLAVPEDIPIVHSTNARHIGSSLALRFTVC